MLKARLFAWIMILALLIADSGQVLYAHTCLKSKHTHYSLNKPSHCCSKKVTNDCAIQKSNCCEVTSLYAKQSFQTDNFDFRQFVQAVPIMWKVNLFEAFALTLNEPRPVTFTPLPAHKHEPGFIQVFRI